MKSAKDWMTEYQRGDLDDTGYSYAEVYKIIQGVILSVKRDALEEAAKIAETCLHHGVAINNVQYHTETLTQKIIAAAIRQKIESLK